MSIEATRQKLEWLEGLHGIRKARLQEVMRKPQWPAADIEMKHKDIEMIERFLDDYRRVLARQQQAAEEAA